MKASDLATEDKKTLDLFSANYDHPGYPQMYGEREKILFSGNSSIRVWYNNVNKSYPLHWHKTFEVIMPLTNYYDVSAEGSLYRIQPGEIMFVPPGTLHECIAPESGTRFVYLFKTTALENLNGFARIQHLLTEPLLFTQAEFPLIYDDVFRLLLKIKDEYFLQSEHELYELTIHSLILEILALLGYSLLNKDVATEKNSSGNKKYTKLFNSLLQYIEVHYAEDLTLEDMADKMGFSKYHFSRLFKEYTSFTFCDYVNFRRIKAAEILLENPEVSVTEVAVNTGFSSIPTFNRLFKKYRGCTPTEYRSKSSRYMHTMAKKKEK